MAYASARRIAQSRDLEQTNAVNAYSRPRREPRTTPSPRGLLQRVTRLRFHRSL